MAAISFSNRNLDPAAHGEELVGEAFQRLLGENQLIAYRYDGFWESMDTFKDKQRLDEMYARGDAPWEVLKRGDAGRSTGRDAGARVTISLAQRASCAATALMLPPASREERPTTPRFSTLPSARTRMTSRSVAAAPCSGSRRTMPQAEFTWVVLSGDARRAEEARCSAARFVGTIRATVVVKEFRDGFFPYIGAGIKDFFETLKLRTRRTSSSHITVATGIKDHRLVFRPYLEHVSRPPDPRIRSPQVRWRPSRPNWYVPLDERTCHTKTRKSPRRLRVAARPALGSPRDVSRADAAARRRVRRAEGYAEAFYAHKLSWVT